MSSNKGGGGDGGGQKAKPGINIGLNVSPEDIGNRGSMAGYFIILAVGAVGVLTATHIATPVKRFLFGMVEGDDKGGGALSSAQPNQLIDALKEVAVTKPSTASWGVKELFGAMDAAGKQNMIEWINKQPK